MKNVIRFSIVFFYTIIIALGTINFIEKPNNNHTLIVQPTAQFVVHKNKLVNQKPTLKNKKSTPKKTFKALKKQIKHEFKKLKKEFSRKDSNAVSLSLKIFLLLLTLAVAIGVGILVLFAGTVISYYWYHAAGVFVLVFGWLGTLFTMIGAIDLIVKLKLKKPKHDVKEQG